MPKTIRTFIAVKIPSTPPLRKVLSQLDLMGRPIKPVSADNLHLTLKFLGETEPEQVPQIHEILSEVTAGELVFDLYLTGLGAFPRLQRPSVVWAGVHNGETLVRVAKALEKQLRRLGFSREKRNFEPHLTLARVRSKPPDELIALLNDQAAAQFGTVSVDAVQLFQSELNSDGPRYTVLATAPLQSA